MEAQVRKLFERYEQQLAGDADMDEVASVYA
ncbi:MAG: nuclear transport factor 2 family protein, partial [Mesorhizobium sp.]